MKKACLFLFNKTINMPKPWFEAGYECHLVDLDFTNEDLELNDGYIRHKVDLSKSWLPPLKRYVFVCAFVPCTNTAVSGSRWFRQKGPEAMRWSLDLFIKAKDIIDWSGAPGFIENPVSTFSSYCGKPDYIFHPYYFTAFCPQDNYTKKTCLWTFNGFRMPERREQSGLGPPDDRIHKASPSKGRRDFRSATPRGFSQAVFEVNAGIWEPSKA